MPLQSQALLRTAVGLLQGVTLYLLYRALTAKAWPATDGFVFAPALLIAVFVPPVVIVGLGRLRPRTLAIWTVAAIALCAGTGIYDIFRTPVDVGNLDTPRIIPSFQLWVSLAALIFIVHSLIAAGEADRRIIAAYPQYFDAAWKHGVQLALAGLFVGTFWALLWLGAALFNLIKLDFFANLLKKPWFSIPITALSFAYAIHVTDVRASLVTGARTLTLTLLSWLLPVMTAFATAFLFALPFTGLEPLWSTRHATATLLIAAAALIFLINAAYQDGLPETPIAALLRRARWAASLVLAPLVALAGYGLLLRVQQHGWTPQRIIAAACVVVAVCYAAGYGFAALRSRLALKQLEITNVLTAYVIVAVTLALFSPIADPARISVADQVARLRSGQVSPDDFDVSFLRFGAGRYGKIELERLAKDPPTPAFAARVQQAMVATSPWQLQQSRRQATPASRTANITVIHPGGRTLPEDFMRHEWTGTPRQWMLPRCLLSDAKCEAILIDLDGDGKDEILLFNAPAGSGVAIKEGKEGRWTLLGNIINLSCPGVREALRAGQFKPAAPDLAEIEVNGQRLSINNSECRK